MDLHEAEVAVIGLGASGLAAARLASAKGGRVHVSDLRTDAPAAARRAELEALGADVELGSHDVARVARADLVVVSPGIPPHAPVLRELAERGVDWISEPELAVRFFSGSLIVVTGTNGKTTTSVLVAHLLERAGIRAALGGNVGGGLAPAASELALLDPPPDWWVLEMSSYQLAGTRTMRADVGVVTNLSPHHLDRYADVESYFADKARLFRNADERSRWVLPAGDARVEGIAGDAPGRRYRFSDEPRADAHAFVDDGRLVLREDGSATVLIDAHELPLPGLHNMRNALAAALAARLAGAAPETIGPALRTARPLPHRLEPVVERDRVLWVNDSKATSVAATESALASLGRPIVLLLGGLDEGQDFRVLSDQVGRVVRHVIAYGAAAPRIAEQLAGVVPLQRVGGDFTAVVEAARAAARPGDAVLLSPACPSFDMFENYEARGRLFADLAREGS